MTWLYSQKHCDVHGFRCTHETHEFVTAGGSEMGYVTDRGYLDWQGKAVDEAHESHWDLRDLARLSGRRFESDGAKVPDWVVCEADTTDLIKPEGAWSFLGCTDDVIGGSIYIHRPGWCTDASWLRVLKLLGWSSRY